ncbi:Exportin-7 [Halotydeus destructor]|nr:Exportin-7 [Halotydeus destructor]
MANDQELAHLELLCKQLYEATDSNNRSKAETALVQFSTSPDCLPKCQLLLERGDSSYAQLLAATTLTKLVGRTPCTLSVQQRLDIRNYVLNYLASRPKLAPFVIQALVQLYARITKLGWFETDKDEYPFRTIIPQIRPFLQAEGSVEYCIIGVQLMSQLTCEVNQISGNEASRSITKQRKIASSFRDSHLYEIFQISHDLLRRALEGWKQRAAHDETQYNLVSHLLRLSLNCLSFDFIGTSPDESSDDLSTVQIPTSWRPAFLDYNTLQLFFDLYHALPPSLASISLSCLVQIASVRRSLFNNTERGKFLLQLVNGVKYVLEHPNGLSDPSCYHEFCPTACKTQVELSTWRIGQSGELSGSNSVDH